MEEGGYDNNGFDEEGGAAGGRGDEDYELPSGDYTRREKKYTDEELRTKLFERNKHGVSVGKERYKDSFVIEYGGNKYNFGEKARAAFSRSTSKDEFICCS